MTGRVPRPTPVLPLPIRCRAFGVSGDVCLPRVVGRSSVVGWVIVPSASWASTSRVPVARLTSAFIASSSPALATALARKWWSWRCGGPSPPVTAVVAGMGRVAMTRMVPALGRLVGSARLSRMSSCIAFPRAWHVSRRTVVVGVVAVARHPATMTPSTTGIARGP